MTTAETIMRSVNPYALIGEDDDGSIVMIEDHSDPDWRLYRIEIKSTPDGERAVAYCRHNPWGGNPYDLLISHVGHDGALCLADDCHGDLASSGLNLRDAIDKARYWCTGFSVLMETGQFPNP